MSDIAIGRVDSSHLIDCAGYVVRVVLSTGVNSVIPTVLNSHSQHPGSPKSKSHYDSHSATSKSHRTSYAKFSMMLTRFLLSLDLHDSSGSMLYIISLTSDDLNMAFST